MAKMFCSLEEAQQMLGMSAEQVRQLVQDGALREFLDGAKHMFKVDDVTELAQAGGSPAASPDQAGGSAIGFAPLGDSAAPADAAEGVADDAALADIGGGDEIDFGGGGGDIGLSPMQSGSEIGLAPLDSGSEIGLVPEDTADQISLDDSTPGGQEKDDTVITSHGVNVLDDSDEALELADPLAQTQLAPDLADQVDLDSGSSGSGLLDLTREADDTSLGAELLDEIYPGEEGGESQVPTQMQLDVEPPPASGGTMEMESPAQVEYVQAAAAVDPNSGSYGAMLLIPLLFLVLLGCVTASTMSGVWPAMLSSLADYVLWVAVGGFVVALIVLGIGSVVSSQSGQGGSRSAKAAKAPKATKEKKAKKEKPKKAKKKK